MIEGYLVVLGVVSLFTLPALTIVLFKRWPYIWWLLWLLSLSYGLFLFFKPFVPSADSKARLAYGLDQAVGMVMISSCLISFVMFLFRSRIQKFIPKYIQRSIVIFSVAIVLVISTVIPLGKLLKL
jgi:hypothetical protein